MFISLVKLKAANGYQNHQAIWSLFPNRPDDKRDHLFRIESVQSGTAKALLQSVTEPVSSKLATVLQSKEFNVELEQASNYRFKITANPTKKVKASGSLLDLSSEPEQVSWLKRKLEGAELTVTSVDTKLVSYKNHHFTRLVTFEGVMKIEDVKRVKDHLIKGIGRKKHAGAGLLSLARII